MKNNNMNTTDYNTYSFILLAVLWWVHSLFHREFFTESNLSAASFSFQYRLLRSSSSCLRLLSHRSGLFSPFLLSFLQITCFRKQSLHEMWPIQSAFLLFTVCRIFPSFLALCSTSSFLTLLVWRSQYLSSTLFQNFPSISFLLPEVSKFQRHTKLCPKCCTLLVN